MLQLFFEKCNCTFKGCRRGLWDLASSIFFFRPRLGFKKATTPHRANSCYVVRLVRCVTFARKFALQTHKHTQRQRLVNTEEFNEPRSAALWLMARRLLILHSQRPPGRAQMPRTCDRMRNHVVGEYVCCCRSSAWRWFPRDVDLRCIFSESFKLQ